MNLKIMVMKTTVKIPEWIESINEVFQEQFNRLIEQGLTLKRNNDLTILVREMRAFNVIVRVALNSNWSIEADIQKKRKVIKCLKIFDYFIYMADERLQSAVIPMKKILKQASLKPII